MAIETVPEDRQRVAPHWPAAPGPVPSEPGIPLPPDPVSYRLKRRLLGKPLHSEELEHQRLGKPTALAVFAVLGALNWVPEWFSPEGPASAEDVGERLADTLLSGFMGDGASGKQKKRKR